MKLISMTDFVLTYRKTPFQMVIYAKVLQQNLRLWMFVPCDKDMNVLEQPRKVSIYDCTVGDHSDMVKYQRAKERCLFDGFEKGYKRKEHGFFTVDNRNFDESKTIEDLLNYEDLEFFLTETAKKQIGL